MTERKAHNSHSMKVRSRQDTKVHSTEVSRVDRGGLRQGEVEQICDPE